jgi:predicted amidohydrolase
LCRKATAGQAAGYTLSQDLRIGERTMSTKIFAIAQSASVAGDLTANIDHHLRLAEMAAMQGAHFLLFPELSLTGYELALSRGCAVAAGDTVLNPLRDLARDAQMTVVAGLPLKDDSGALHIGALAFCPDGSTLSYAKQNLYGEEKNIFTPGDKAADCMIGVIHVGLAICADTDDPRHAVAAAARGAKVYAAGVLVSDTGYAATAEKLAGTARQHAMAVLMANHSGATGGWQSAGRSALWAEDGSLIAACEDATEALLFCRKTSDGGWETWITAAQQG